MTKVNQTNRFFKEKVYSNLVDFAFLPLSWAFEPEERSAIPMLNVGNLMLAALLAPILIPAIIGASAIAVCLAGLAALFHGLSLIVAKIADACSSTEEPTMAPA